MYTYKTVVSYSQVDSNQDVKLSQMVDYFQDGAVFDGESVGIGVNYLLDRHLAWLLSYWQVEIIEYPKHCEEIEVSAIPYLMKGPFGFRDFTIKNAKGELLVKAYSLWTLCDMQAQKPFRVPPEIAGAYVLGEQVDMDHGSRKLNLPEGGVKQDPFTVGRQMLDTNLHVNNAQYIVIAQNYIPMDFKPQKMRVEYKAQAKMGDVMVPRVIDLGDGWAVSLENENGEEYAAVEFK